jgi:hypothetical protein
MRDEPAPERDQPAPKKPTSTTDDLGYRDSEEERAYERAQPESQPTVSSEPEPDAEPADAG